MRKLFFLLVLACLVAGAYSSVGAWEFRLKGEAEWRMRYISRTGPGDLFGNANEAQATPYNGTSIGMAGPQALAVRLEGYSSKGSDAAYGEQRFFFFPEFRLNEAVRLRANVTFQGNVNANYTGGGANWATNPHYSGWIMMDSRDLYTGTGLAVPVVRCFWGTAQTPWGIIAIGTRPGGFGMGWVLHQDDSYARSLALIVPYGPLSFVVSQYLHNSFEKSDPNDDRNYRLNTLTIASTVDQNEVMQWNTALALTYRAGNIDMGSLIYVISRDGQHYNPQPGGTYQDDRSGSFAVQLFTSSNAWANTLGTAYTGTMPIYTGDAKIGLGITYFSYTDGIFSLNVEYDYLVFNIRRNGGRPIAGLGQAWAAEASVLVGPAKFSLANFYRSGHDRRGGLFNLWSPVGQAYRTGLVPVFWYDHDDYFLANFLGGGDAPIRPYCFLLGLFGTGSNCYSTTGQCVYEDFFAYAARADYAVASNLNVFASAIIGQRASNTGTPQGYYLGTWGGAPTTNNNPPMANTPLNGTLYNGGCSSPTTTNLSRGFVVTPNVPDNDLGWEVDAGFEWKLLEGLTFKMLFAYWQPGKWFNWAYRDMTHSNPTSFDYTSGTTYTDAIIGVVNPFRTISPIIGMQGNLLMEF